MRRRRGKFEPFRPGVGGHKFLFRSNTGDGTQVGFCEVKTALAFGRSGGADTGTPFAVCGS